MPRPTRGAGAHHVPRASRGRSFKLRGSSGRTPAAGRDRPRRGGSMRQRNARGTGANQSSKTATRRARQRDRGGAPGAVGSVEHMERRVLMDATALLDDTYGPDVPPTSPPAEPEVSLPLEPETSLL